MANRPAPALKLRDGDREELGRLARSSTVRSGPAARARIVLLAADGVANAAIADKVGVSGRTVLVWDAGTGTRVWAGWSIWTGRVDHERWITGRLCR